MKLQNDHSQELREDNFMKKPDVAHLLGVSVGAVDNYRKQGLPAIKLGGRVLFRREDVARFIESRAENRSDGAKKG